MAPDISWIYLLIFLAIPLSRIIPKILAKRKMRNNISDPPSFGTSLRQNFNNFTSQTSPEDNSLPREFPEETSKPQTNEMRVLGELNRGTNTFENIQRKTELTGEELNSILENLEERELMRVEQKQGLTGPKVNLYATEKGFKEYYS